MKRGRVARSACENDSARILGEGEGEVALPFMAPCDWLLLRAVERMDYAGV